MKNEKALAILDSEIQALIEQRNEINNDLKNYAALRELMTGVASRKGFAPSPAPALSVKAAGKVMKGRAIPPSETTRARIMKFFRENGNQIVKCSEICVAIHGRKPSSIRQCLHVSPVFQSQGHGYYRMDSKFLMEP